MGKTEDSVEDIQRAIQLSKLGQANIGSAHVACDQWESILGGKEDNKTNNQDPRTGSASRPQQLPPSIHTLCLALYASCLVRTGRDDKAVEVYDKALALLPSKKDPATRDLILGKSKAHQRLLQYSEALEAYTKLVELTNKYGGMDLSHVIGAATCSLRLRQPQTAQDILATACCDWLKKEQDDKTMGSEEIARLERDWTQARLFLHVLDHCLGIEGSVKRQQSNTSSTSSEDWPKSAILSLSIDQPLYVWIHDTTFSQSSMAPKMTPLGPQLFADKSARGKSMQKTNDAFLAMMKINQTPWDDPFLLQLDDKVLLHRLLSSQAASSSSKFWPIGYVLPTDGKKFRKDQQVESSSVSGDSKSWIAKTRAGYGSHGNQIFSLSEALDKAESSNDGESLTTTTTPQDDEFLLQRLIDPTLLIQGRKFSLRLYVVYFSPSECYLSQQGLVKLAAIEALREEGVGDDSADRRAFMTNSGREQHMKQHEMLFLRHECKLFQSEDEYASFWSKIEDSVQQVMKSCRKYRYENENERESTTTGFESRRQALGIPKILGLDYVVDANYQPSLLEVNRFPGLEPRDDSDRMVKHQVVRDAWLCAQERKTMRTKTEETASMGGDNHPLQYLLDHLPPVSDDCPYSLKRLD
ncbi:MAG: hypothetical protein SGBAC_010418 [Bacillariaceae sp.]